MLACIATSLAQEIDRSKRHLAFWNDLFTSQLFESDATTKDAPVLRTPAVVYGNKENFKLYRIPGFNNILVRAVPKVKTNLTTEDNVTTTTTLPPSEVEKENEPTVAILENYLGTKTMNDTLKALQGVRDMLQSGVLAAQSEAAEESHKETVFVIPPMMPEIKLQPDVVKPPKVPVTPFLSHIAPMSVVQNFVLPDLKPLRVQAILPVPVIPSAQYFLKQVKGDEAVTSVSSPEIVVTGAHNPLPPPAFFVNRFQHMIRMPFDPLPTLPSLPSISSYLVPRPMNHVNVVDIPFQPVLNTSPVFVEPSNVAVKGNTYPYKPCCKHTVGNPANLIERNFPVMKPLMLVKDTVMVPRPPSIIIDRLEKIAGGKIFAQRPILVMPPSPATWVSPVASVNGNVSGQKYSYKITNEDGTVTTFTRLSDNFDPGYDLNMEGDDGYYQTDDGRIFYSRLVKDPSLIKSKDFQDEAMKEHKKNQYTVTNVEEFKNLLSRDDVQVTYGTDEDNDPFLSYRVPSGRYSFRQVKNVSKLNEDNLPPLKFDGIKESSNKSITTEKGIELPSGPSKYSFKQIHEDGSITEYIAYDSADSDVAVVQNDQVKENSIDKGQTPTPGGVMLKNPTFVFKQNNYNNSQPAVGQVESTPTRFDEKDKVNSNEHERLDTEVHSVPLSVVATVPSPVGLSSTLPKDFIYVPPKADVPFTSTRNAVNQRVPGNYPFKITDGGNTLKSIEPSSNANIPSFSNTNPIVVPGESEEDDGSSYRGDIPEAYS